MNRVVGFLVNPVAGTGGKAGHRGSDDPGLRAEATAQGAVPVARIRATMVAELLASGTDVSLLTWGGAMGSKYLEDAGVHHRTVGRPVSDDTTSRDTTLAAGQLVQSGADLLVFVGGDGTARDVQDAIGESIPVVGVPAGVKMYSGVFSSHPRVAVNAIRQFVQEPNPRTVSAEVIDLDEEAMRSGRVRTQLHGFMLVPEGRLGIQGLKSPTPPSENSAIAAIAKSIVESSSPTIVTILGPGSTVHAIGKRFGSGSTLLGVDIIRGSTMLVADANESSLLEFLDSEPACQLVVSPIGGQGFVLGRGNQQLSPAVMQRIGLENLRIVATPSKLQSLAGRPLLVDSGDEGLDDELSGWVKVTVGHDEVAVYPIRAAAKLGE